MRSINLSVAMLILAWPMAAMGQSQNPQDEAYDLAAVEADHAICGFPLTDEQQDVMAQRRDALTSQGAMSEADLATLQVQVTASVKAQQADGLCRPDGPEARLYKRRLTGFGLL